MGYLILPTLLLIFVPGPGIRAERAQQLEDFSRFSRAIGQRVSLVDQSGQIREGIVEVATADGVTLRFGSATQSFPRAEVASARWTKDGRIDGAIKGALVGLALAVLGNGFDDDTTPERIPWALIASFSGIGYVIDATETQGKPLYRAPSASAPILNISLRF